jgi:predicted nuclease with TOPRIM domain
MISIEPAHEREHLLDRLQNLRAILPAFAQELANARRELARLRLQNRRLEEQVRQLQRQHTTRGDGRLRRDAAPGTALDSARLARRVG